MRKWIGWMLVCCIALCMGSAQADALQAAFDDPSWEGWEMALMDEQSMRDMQERHAAVIMRKGDRNILVLLKNDTGTYEIETMGNRAVYQGHRLPMKMYFEDIYFYCLFQAVAENGEAVIEEYHYAYAAEPYGKPRWMLEGVYLDQMDTQSFIDYGKMYINYFEQMPETLLKHFGKLDRAVAEFDIDAFPRTYAQVQQQVGPPTRVGAEEQLDPLPQGAQAAIAADAPVPVYTGPTVRYAQSAIAEIDAQTPVQVLGLEGNHAFIAYAHEGATHYGYIADRWLAELPDTTPLPFDCLQATLLTDTVITEGAAGSAEIETLPAGLDVLYLATLGEDMTYIEADNGTRVRGFVPSETISVRYELERWDHNTEKLYARVTEDAQVIDEPYRKHTPEVLGTFQQGDEVVYWDSLYGEWGLIEIEVDGQTVLGYIPRTAVEAIGIELDGNG